MVAFTFEAFGWTGAILFLLAYWKLVRGQWSSNSLSYHIYNLLGGLLLVLNTLYYEAWAAVFINAAWAAIAGFGLMQRHLLLSKRSSKARAV